MMGHQDKIETGERRSFPHHYPGMMILQSLCLSCLLVVSGFLLPDVSLAAETMDRLFFSPQDRVYLEKLRWATPDSLSSLQEHNKTPAVTESKPQVFTLGGTVTKKNGVQALWLNSVKYNGTDLPANVELRPPFIAGQILLQVPETGSSYALRPGQSVDIGDGQIKESYQRPPATSATDAQPVPKSAPSSEGPAATVQPPKVIPPLKP
jgi:hypothetical protein